MKCCGAPSIMRETVPCETVEARPWIFVTLATCVRCWVSKIVAKDVRRGGG